MTMLKRIKTVTVATLGSHSALDICRGAKDEGLNTLVIAQRGREKTYKTYYKSKNGLGCVDECIVVNKFSDILSPEIQKLFRSKIVIFVPHRSFEAYLNFDYEAIESEFHIPIFGNKYLLKIEERGRQPNQYDILRKANIRFPKQFLNPKKIDRLCLVKILERQRGFERAFFLVKSQSEYKREVNKRIKANIFTKDELSVAVIEEFIMGVAVNFHFFYSPLSGRLELLGTDTRRQTNIEGITKLPALFQRSVGKTSAVKYEEAGHVAVTVLESLLEDAFSIGERFVKAAKDIFSPGIIGPFALQTIITPGPPKKDIIVIDVSPRMPGSPGVSATPYGGYLFGESMSMGRRVAMEIRQALRKNHLHKIVT